jgi:hypothetical protein
MPRDASPTCRTMISMSSSVGISFNSFDLAKLSMKIGKQDGDGLMKSTETGSEHNFDNMVSSSCVPKSVLRSRSSRVVSLSPVYDQAARARC